MRRACEVRRKGGMGRARNARRLNETTHITIRKRKGSLKAINTLTTNARPLNPAALAFVPFRIVLVRVQSLKILKGRRATRQLKRIQSIFSPPLLTALLKVLHSEGRRCAMVDTARPKQGNYRTHRTLLGELELELILSQMAQKPMLRG